MSFDFSCMCPSTDEDPNVKENKMKQKILNNLKRLPL